MTAIRRFGLVFIAAMVGASLAQSASFGDLSSSSQRSQYVGAGPYVSGPYAPGPYAPTPAFGGGSSPSGGPEGVPPPDLDAPAAATIAPMPPSPDPYLILRPHSDLPRGQLELETFGQINSTTDPLNPWGLSTPFMFVPWSTPLSGWTNAQTWNWWRERSGALPPNW